MCSAVADNTYVYIYLYILIYIYIYIYLYLCIYKYISVRWGATRAPSVQGAALASTTTLPCKRLVNNVIDASPGSPGHSAGEHHHPACARAEPTGSVSLSCAVSVSVSVSISLSLSLSLSASRTPFMTLYLSNEVLSPNRTGPNPSHAK